MYVISGSTHQRLGASLAEEMNSEFCGVVNRHFPDGERYIRVLMDVANQDVVVVQNTFPDITVNMSQQRVQNMCVFANEQLCVFAEYEG